MTTDELVAVSQNRDSSDGMATKQFLITCTSLDPHNRSLMEYWNSCVTELSKFTYVR